LRTRAEGLLVLAQSGAGAFERAMDAAERAAAAAGAPNSENWIAAQQAVSGAVAARYPATEALGNIDALVANAVQSQGGLVPTDLAAVRGIAAQISEIDAAQAARIEAVQRQLAR
jgi:hypothetical protein